MPSSVRAMAVSVQSLWVVAATDAHYCITEMCRCCICLYILYFPPSRNNSLCLLTCLSIASVWSNKVALGEQSTIHCWRKANPLPNHSASVPVECPCPLCVYFFCYSFVHVIWSKGFCFLLQQTQTHVLQPFSCHLTQKQTACLEENGWRIKAWLCCLYWSDLDPTDNKHFTFIFSNSGFLWRQMSLGCRRGDTFLLLMINRMIPEAQLYFIVEGGSCPNPTFQFQLALHSKTNKIKHQWPPLVCFAISSTAAAGTIDSHHLCKR